MLLILSNSMDGTTDAVVEALGADNIFRFNVDQWRDYDFSIGPDTFDIGDPSGRRITEQEVRSVYVRKPHFSDAPAETKGGNLEQFSRSQVLYVVNEIYNLLAAQGKVCLVEKRAEQRIGKIMQMRLAARMFSVPPWEVFWGRVITGHADGAWVAKTLKATFTEDYKFLFTRMVERSRLDPAYPWFTQKRVEASEDVTVAYVRGKCFAFCLHRQAFAGDDWRATINGEELPWTPMALPHEVEAGINEFMNRAQLKFGRLDFLRAETGVYYFLEVNTNGQWLWLDMDQSGGLFAAIVAELKTSISG